MGEHIHGAIFVQLVLQREFGRNLCWALPLRIRGTWSINSVPKKVTAPAIIAPRGHLL
jgi:hypothetical protein